MQQQQGDNGGREISQLIWARVCQQQPEEVSSRPTASQYTFGRLGGGMGVGGERGDLPSVTLKKRDRGQLKGNES